MWDEAEQYYIRHFNLCIKNVQLAHVRLFIGCDYVEKDLSRIDTPRAIYACTASEYAIKIIWRIFSARSKNNFDFCCCCCLISLYVQRWKKIFHSWIFVVVGYGVCWGIFHYARVNKCRTCMMQCLSPMVTHNLNNKILLIDWFVVFYFFCIFYEFAASLSLWWCLLLGTYKSFWKPSSGNCLVVLMRKMYMHTPVNAHVHPSVRNNLCL